MNSTSLVASVSSRLSRLGDATAELFDHSQHAIVLLNSLLRSERERLLHERDVDLGAHDKNLPRGRDRPRCTTFRKVSQCIRTVANVEERLTAQSHDIIQRLFDRTLEVRGSIPLGSTRKRRRRAEMRGVFVFGSAPKNRLRNDCSRGSPRHLPWTAFTTAAVATSRRSARCRHHLLHNRSRMLDLVGKRTRDQCGH